MAAPDVIVVGDVMLDVSVAAPALAAGGDVHGSVRMGAGGAGANAAVWAARSGARVRLFGRVGGDDVPARVVREALEHRGVDARLSVDPEAGTGAMLVVSEAGERSMVSDPGANARVPPEDIPAQLDAGCVLVSGYLLYRAGSEKSARAALDRARAKRVAVDAASWPLLEAYGAERFVDAASSADLVLANEREAEVLTGVRGNEAARRLGDAFPAAVLKLGPGGAVAVEAGELLEVGPVASEAIDARGAGDAFAGVLMAALAAGAPLEEAAVRACAAGAEAVTHEGAWPQP
jgi:sugar/nucleoside kinase (ribokinase family)